MKRPNPVKFSDLIKDDDERISVIDAQLNGKGRTRTFIQLQRGSAISPKRARYLAEWLQRAADYIDEAAGAEKLAIKLSKGA